MPDPNGHAPADAALLKGRYRLLDVVGEGGMAIVWRAEDTELRRTVAVKVLREQFARDPEFLDRFRSEAQAAAGLNDPGIVSVFDVGEDGGRHYLVMEYVAGGDLKDVIRAEAPLPAHRAIEIGARIARAVAAAHAKDLVHRDIKPQNVLVGPDGRMKVADFGIARAVSAAGMTAPGIVMGTVHYVAPEQAAGQPATPASDVYSIGVVLYEMLAGRVPFEAESSLGVAMKIMGEEPEPLAVVNPRAPEVLVRIVERAMAKDPAARYRDAGALADALEQYGRWSAQQTAPLATAAAPEVAPDPGATRTMATPLVVPPGRTAAPAAPAGRPAKGPLLDWRGLGLAVAAAIALGGLIPLWLGVVDRIGGDGAAAGVGVLPSLPGFPAAPTPTPGPTPTPTPVWVRVPGVVGMDQVAAERDLRAAGLAASDEPVVEQGVPLGQVVRQQPEEGAEVLEDTVVKLYVSAQGSVVVPAPGPDYSATELALQQAGLVAKYLEEWTGDDAGRGRILRLNPPPGLSLPLGGTVNVHVDGGTWLGMGVTFEDGVYLAGGSLPSVAAPAGGTLTFTPLWEAVGGVSRDYGARALITDRSGFGTVLGEARQPLSPDRPSSGWAVGEQVRGAPLSVVVDPTAPPGSYSLWIEVFVAGAEETTLPVAGLPTRRVVDALVEVAAVTITAP